MNIEKLKPWNWFKHEDAVHENENQIPVKRNDAIPLGGGSATDSLLTLHREMDRLFDSVFSSFGMPTLSRSFPSRMGLLESAGRNMATSHRPQLDIAGDDNQYEISINLPGLSSNDISIEVSGERLFVRGQKEEQNESKDKHFYRVERSVGAFQRSLTLPEDANSYEISASLKDGVLVLSIPRQQLPQSEVKHIPIST